MNKKYFLITLILITSLLTLSCQGAEVAKTPLPEPVPEPIEIVIAAVGDVMMHGPQFKAAYVASTGTYDFSDCFADIAPVIDGADLAIANIETTFAGAERGYSGYPAFNSPEQLLPALKDAGFDVLTTANNHTMDRGTSGIVSTIDFIQQGGFYQTGSYSTTAAAIQPLIVDVKGLKIGIVAATYSLNGFVLPEGKEYMVDLIDEQLLIKRITAARSAGADAVAVSLHFGNEYQRQPSDYQKKYADIAIKAGADIILGSHPHVLQPIEMRTVPATADTTTKSAIVVWSMGNFISNQRDRYKDSGMIFTFKIRQEAPGEPIQILEATYLPTYVYKGPLNGKSTVYQVLDVGKYTKVEGATGPPGGSATLRRLHEVWTESTSLITETPARITYQGLN